MTPNWPGKRADVTYTLPYCSPGCDREGLIYWSDWTMEDGLVSPDGRVYPLPGNISPIQYYNGYASVWETDESGLYYLDGQARRRTEAFDWCGDITPDGRGFVGLDEKIYRIQFEN